MSNRTLLEDLSEAPVEEFPLPSTSIDDNTTVAIEEHGNLTTTPDPSHVPDLARFIDKNPWVVYAVVVGLTLCVAIIVFILLKSLCRKKKQVIQQDDDPVLTSTYDDGSDSLCLRICCCRCKRKSSFRGRQNSESNLDPYKRPPLPPIGAKEGDFHYISTFSSNGLSLDEKHNGAYINAIRGVAHMPQRSENYRALPPLRMYEQPPEPIHKSKK